MKIEKGINIFDNIQIDFKNFDFFEAKMFNLIFEFDADIPYSHFC